MSALRLASPSANKMTVVSPMPTEMFEEPEQNGQFDISAPWVEIDLDCNFFEETEYPTEFSGIRMVPTDYGREHVVIGDQLIDSRLCDFTVETCDDHDDLLPSRNCSPLSPGTLELPRPSLIYDHLPWPPRALTTSHMEIPLDAYGKPERPVVFRGKAIGSTDDSTEFYLYATSGQVFMKSGFLSDVTPYVDAMNGFNREKKPMNQRKLEFFRNCEVLVNKGERFSDVVAEKMWKEVDGMGFEKEFWLAESINYARRIPIEEMKKNRKRSRTTSEHVAKRIKLEEPDEYEDNKENVKVGKKLKTSEEVEAVIKRIKVEEPDEYEHVARDIKMEEPDDYEDDKENVWKQLIETSEISEISQKVEDVIKRIKMEEPDDYEECMETVTVVKQELVSP